MFASSLGGLLAGPEGRTGVQLSIWSRMIRAPIWFTAMNNLDHYAARRTEKEARLVFADTLFPVPNTVCDGLHIGVFLAQCR
jgi:hypothetical protein